MKKWLSWLRKHRKDWPVFVSLMVICLNIELVVTPRILRGIFGLSGHDLGMAAGFWSSAELLWWIWFSLWLFKEKIRKLASVNQAIEVSREIFDDFDWQEFLKPRPGDSFLLWRLKNMAYRHIREFDLDQHQKDGAFMEILGFAKGLGYVLACFLVAIFGLMPLFWILGLMICLSVKWRMAYAALFVSNFIKNYFFAALYEEIGFWWLLGAFVLMVFVVSFVVGRLMNILRAKAQKRSRQ